ncbi:sulfite exporter TauE/SafE family protein [Dethiosulfovibrio sp. F2B]|nr:sulfite exporter TauE/SafE family protein [Dethiosulfovibrio faecalis]
MFSLLLVAAGIVMLFPVSERRASSEVKRLGAIRIRSGVEGEFYDVNLWIALPVAILTGFASGMVGVSGGSFLVPLMVFACGIPMHTAVGTASILIAITSFMGFAGHAVQGDFNASWAVPLAVITALGGILGGRMALSAKPKHLKKLFAYTNWLAALFMIVNALHTRGSI